MNKYSTLNEFNSTIFVWGGQEFRTIQDPYVSDDGSQYKALAVDVFDNEYVVLWDVTNPDTTDESEACHWDNPVSVTPGK